MLGRPTLVRNAALCLAVLHLACTAQEGAPGDASASPPGDTQVSALATAVPTNLALGKPVTASSRESTALDAPSAVDGNAATRWGSLGQSDPQWLAVDLQATHAVSRVRIQWEAAFASAYRIEVSTDGTSWAQAYATTAGNGAVDDVSFPSLPARYVRVWGTRRGTPYGYSIWELEVYGAPSAPPPVATNVALGKPATALSRESAALDAANAVDGNLSTRWGSAGQSDPQWIRVDLQGVFDLSRVKLSWEAAHARAYQLQVSTDGATWTTAHSTTTGDGGVDDVVLFPAPAARYLRVWATQRGTPYGYSLWELEAHGTPHATGSGDTPPSGGVSTGALGADPVALGTVYVAQQRAVPVVVTNRTSAPVTIASAVASGVGLSQALTLPATVAAGASTWLRVSWTPAAPGAFSGSVALRDAAGTTVGSVPVSGTAVALDAASSVSVVAYGARGDGVTDDRSAFQAAADAARLSGKALYVPRPPAGAHYRLSGVVKIYGSVVGEPGGARPEIRMYGANGADAPNTASPYTIFYLKGSSRPATITGLHLNGGRSFAPGTNVYGLREQSHGIAVQGVSNLWIENNVVENTQGDNILIGGEVGAPPCVNVRVVNNVLRNAMRCAVFPGDTRFLAILLNTIGKVVEYQSAIDFEPNVAPQADWDAEVAYNDFGTTLQYDHVTITSTAATGIPSPGGRIRFHDNRGSRGRYSMYVNLSPANAWVAVDVQPLLP